MELMKKGSGILRPLFQFHEGEKKLWEIMAEYIPSTVSSIQKQFVDHIEYSLAKTRFNFDIKSAYRAIALSVRDRLIESWNDTNNHFYFKKPKRVYYLSMEFLLGRLLQNNLINMDLETKYRQALEDLGYNLEEIYE